jgi:hypothetical protein
VAEYKSQAHYNIRRCRAKARYNMKFTLNELLCDTVTPRLVMIRGYEYTRVKLAMVCPLTTIGGRSQRVAIERGIGERCALEACVLILREFACLAMWRFRRCTWPGRYGALTMSEWNHRTDSETAV